MVRNVDDMSRAFGLIVRDTSTYYVIGYQPENSTMDGKYPEDRGQVEGRRLKVRARKGYAAVALPPQETSAGGRIEVREGLEGFKNPSGTREPYEPSERVNLLNLTVSTTPVPPNTPESTRRCRPLAVDRVAACRSRGRAPRMALRSAASRSRLLTQAVLAGASSRASRWGSSCRPGKCSRCRSKPGRRRRNRRG